jgi:predicted nucleic acid-binding Zn ribbon protein
MSLLREKEKKMILDTGYRRCTKCGETKDVISIDPYSLDDDKIFLCEECIKKMFETHREKIIKQYGSREKFLEKEREAHEKLKKTFESIQKLNDKMDWGLITKPEYWI